MKREAQFTTKFKKWVHAGLVKKGSRTAAAFEIKVTTKKSIPFSAVKKHQLDALSTVTHGVFTQKIPDAGWQNPFDMYVLAGQEGYVVLAFLEPRKPSKVWLVKIDVFLQMSQQEERRSADEPMLLRYHEHYGHGCEMHLI